MNRPEEDFEQGHPKRFDYDPNSPEAIEWARKHVFPKGERDFPPDHPKAMDTPGNTNATEWRAGVDPAHPENEPFTGRTPEQAAAVHRFEAELSRKAKESPVAEPTVAPPPPAVAR